MYKNSMLHLAVVFQVYLLWKSLEGDLERELQCFTLKLFESFPNSDFADTCGVSPPHKRSFPSSVTEIVSMNSLIEALIGAVSQMQRALFSPQTVSLACMFSISISKPAGLPCFGTLCCVHCSVDSTLCSPLPALS